jgi:drug/metabolite transporter (DMT)-like permease
MAALLGPFLVLVFCVSQAMRDVHFGNVFQGVDFFAVILVAFLLSTLLFGAIAAVSTPGELRKLRGHLSTVLAMNGTTALAWTCYFFALTHLEPSIVNTVHSGMGPLTVIALAACGVRLAKPSVLGRGEILGYAGMALSLAGLGWVVLSGQSGLPGADHATSLVALALLLVSGSSITISLLYCKRLHDHGVSPEVVTTVRYLALILLAAGVEASKGRLAGIDGLGDLVTLSVIATVLIVSPLFALQVGIALTAPLTAHVLRSLGPVCVFALQQLDGRTVYSAPTLVCIIAYSAFAIASNLAHGWRERPA